MSQLASVERRFIECYEEGWLTKEQCAALFQDVLIAIEWDQTLDDIYSEQTNRIEDHDLWEEQTIKDIIDYLFVGRN